jgi:Protein of unknown function (DUF4058)
MPLLDHFHPPVNEQIQWNTFHSAWASFLANSLNDVVPPGYRVHEYLKLGGGLEIDVAAVNTESDRGDADAPRVSSWHPPRAVTTDAIFPERFEVLVFRHTGGRQLVAAIELVSPSNKDCAASRQAFTSKVVGYLHEGVSVLVVDVVTEYLANLHNEIVGLMGMSAELLLTALTPLYAATYRPVIRDKVPQLDAWVRGFNLGDELPTMPLRLIADYFVPVELEATYAETCRRRRVRP